MNIREGMIGLASALIATSAAAQTAGTQIVPLAMFGGETLINSTSWQTVTRTTYTSIPGLFAAIPVASGATRKYYLVIRRADNQPGGSGSNWRFSCSSTWNGGTAVPGHGFTLPSNWGPPDEGSTDWVEVPPTALNSSCNPAYWEIDAAMVNAGPVMRVMSVSMAAVDVINGTNIAYSQSSSGNYTYPPMSDQYDTIWSMGPGGNVGIGTATPHYSLETAGYVKASLSSPDPSGIMIGAVATNQPRIGFNASDDSMRFKVQINSVNTSTERLSFYAGPLGNIATNEAMSINGTGNVGIGTTNPQAKLEINGNLRFTADGSVQTTAWTGVLCGGDYAEAVDASGDRKQYEPGDVLVLSTDTNGSVEKSTEPYSTMVAGIFATKPGVIGRRQTLASTSDDIPMAMVGIVPTKVTAEDGPIHQGDLLVTSSKVGYAMKGTDRGRMLGAVIGKAMGSLDSGTGVIEVLVTLQ